MSFNSAVKLVKQIPELRFVLSLVYLHLCDARYLTWRDILRAINVYWVNDGPKLVLILIWLAGNVAYVLYNVICAYPSRACNCTDHWPRLLAH